MLIKSLIIFCFLIYGGKALGCLWDTDTLRDELSENTSVYDLIMGQFPHHGEAYYEERVKLLDVKEELTEQESHDLGVALTRLGKFEKAKAIFLELYEKNPEGYEIYKPEYQADRLVSLMDSLGVKEWNHVFHDVGGMWTWELVRKHKRRVKKLVMLNSINLTEGFFPPLRMKDDWLAKAAMKAYEKRGSNKVMINQLFKETVNDPKQISASDKAGYKLPLLEGKTNGIYYFFTQTCNLLPNYTSVIEDADIETAVVWGKNDEMLRWTPQATKLKRMLKIKESNIHLLDAKHFLQEEKPEELNAILVDFFRN